MRRCSWVVYLALVMALASAGSAEVLMTPSISSTDSGGIVTLARASEDLVIINDAASANEVYLRIFYCGEPAVAAVAAAAGTGRLQPGESITLKRGRSDAAAYCQFAHITASTETATLRFFAK